MEQVHTTTATKLENPNAAFSYIPRQRIESLEVNRLVIMFQQIADPVAGRRACVLRYRLRRCVFLEKFGLKAIPGIDCAFGVTAHREQLRLVHRISSGQGLTRFWAVAIRNLSTFLNRKSIFKIVPSFCICSRR